MGKHALITEFDGVIQEYHDTLITIKGYLEKMQPVDAQATKEEIYKIITSKFSRIDTYRRIADVARYEKGDND